MMKSARFYVPIVILISIAAYSGYVLGAGTEEAQVPLKELKANADEVLNQPNVSARKEINVVFKLADRLLEENQYDEAEKYLVRGLQHFPWNLKYQIVYAEMMAKKGQRDLSQDRARLVFENGETDDLLRRARIILGKETLPEFEKMRMLPGEDYRLVLVPLQGCDAWLIARMKEELAKALGITVYVQALSVPFPASGRDRSQSAINVMRKQINSKMTDPSVSAAMTTLRLTNVDLKEDINVLKLVRYMMNTAEVARLEAYLEDGTGKDLQWDADQLQANLIQAVAPYRGKNIGYLGITSADIYANDYNFLFGWSNPSGAVMSYRRFTAEFNDEVPNQERLVKRTLKQCLSSAGHLYGVKKCTNPQCARVYPNSLAEHDAKKETLCSECREAFKAVFDSGRRTVIRDLRGKNEYAPGFFLRGRDLERDVDARFALRPHAISPIRSL